MGGNRVRGWSNENTKAASAKVAEKATSQALLRDLGGNSPFFAVKVFGCPTMSDDLSDCVLVRRGQGLNMNQHV